AMSSTWDRTGGNKDGTDFKRIEGTRNILFDADGPGCIHRIFSGRLGAIVQGTRIQITLDNQTKPIFDMPVNRFFDYQRGPFPYPLVFHKTYPGTLVPIPFAKHCKVVLINEQQKNWGNYWQVTWTRYGKNANVKSLRWPLGEYEKQALNETARAWLVAESTAPMPPEKWTLEKRLPFRKGQTHQIELTGCGIIKQMRVKVWPRSATLHKGIRMKIFWDGLDQPSVDVPLGYFFGNGDYDHPFASHYSSLVLGSMLLTFQTYTTFPMPYSNGAIIRFENRSGKRVEYLEIKLDIETRKSLPPNYGRFHTTWTEKRANSPDSPKYDGNPVHIVLDRSGFQGKYVGVLLQVHWPTHQWWGEGDWLIWSDENDWPPSYHGTGSEEYFNSGWGSFDRKAVSGYVKMRPVDACLYSFHLNDAFQFRKNIRVAEETWVKEKPIWGSTAYWYALPPQPANSRQDIIPR
ncbi:MAG: glycoside hydrolase family 172 protein, partial [Planctomycetota bacterium]